MLTVRHIDNMACEQVMNDLLTFQKVLTDMNWFGIFKYVHLRKFICKYKNTKFLYNLRHYDAICIFYPTERKKLVSFKFISKVFGTSAPKPVTTTTKSTINGNTGIALDYMAHKVCPKHLTRNKYLMYYSYVKRCYTFVISDQADWFTAKEDCSAKSGNLMNIHSSLENFFLGMRDKVALGNGNTYVWIGLSDTSSPGHFSWTNGRKLYCFIQHRFCLEVLHCT